MAKVQVSCDWCGSCAFKEIGSVNRSRKHGRPVYCGRECAGLARRKHVPDHVKRALKAAYDRDYRNKNAEALKEKRAAYYQRTKDPEKERVARKKRAHLHAEYCRRPEYKEWKREYDRKHRAIKQYGEFADCFLLMQDIRAECLAQQPDHEIRQAAGTLNKSQNRKRDYERANSNSPEIGPLGHPGSAS